MELTTIAAVARQAGMVTRRGSIRALGGATLAASLTAPTATHAGKAGKQRQRRCKRQRGQCLAFLEAFCEPKVDPPACVAAGFPCCEPFARCNAEAGIECLFEAVLG